MHCLRCIFSVSVKCTECMSRTLRFSGLCSVLRSFCFLNELYCLIPSSKERFSVQLIISINSHSTFELKTLFKFAFLCSWCLHWDYKCLNLCWTVKYDLKIACKSPRYRITPTCLKPWVIDYWLVSIWRAGDWLWGDLWWTWPCFRFRTSLSGQIWSMHVRLACVKPGFSRYWELMHLSKC